MGNEDIAESEFQICPRASPKKRRPSSLLDYIRRVGRRKLIASLGIMMIGLSGTLTMANIPPPVVTPIMIPMQIYIDANITCTSKAPSTTPSMKSFTTGDIDGDDTNEIVLDDRYGNQFLVYEIVGGELQNTYNISVASLEIGDINQMDAADVDGDGHLEFMHLSMGPYPWQNLDPYLRIFRNDTQVHYFNASLPNCGPRVVKAGDYDNDNDIEILIGGHYDGLVTVWEFDGGMWTSGPSFTAEAPSSMTAAQHYVYDIAIVDIDGDLRMETIVGDSYGQVQILENYQDEMTVSQKLIFTEASDTAKMITSLSIGDLDNDGSADLEILATSFCRGIQTLIFKNQDGTYVRAFNCNSSRYYAMSSCSDIGDLDNDGSPEFVVTEHQVDSGGLCRLRVFEWASDEWIEAAYYDFLRLDSSLNYIYGAQIIDMEGDGDLEIVVKPENEPIQVLEYTPPRTETTYVTATTTTTATDGDSRFPIEWLALAASLPVGLIVFVLAWKMRNPRRVD